MAVLLLPFVGLGLLSLILRALPKAQLSAGYSSSVAVYDRERHLLRLSLAADDKYRLWTPLKELSPTLVEATLLHEDRHYYRHFAVNPVALLRAVYVTYVGGGRRVGGSTISMQVARLRYRIASRTVLGKLRQIGRAVLLELRYSKAEILEAYLNLVPYGQNIEGVSAASLIYFGKPASRLSLSEALTLSVIPQSPTRRAPGKAATSDEKQAYREGNQALLVARAALFRKWVVEHPSASRDEPLFRLPLALRELSALPFRAPHFVDAVLETRAAEPRSRSHEVHTTLDLRLQQLVERQLRGYVARHRRFGLQNSAALLVDTRDLGVRAMVGSADFFDNSIEGQVNGTLAKRSPGSTLKPFIYALGIDQGVLHPLTMVKDAQLAFLSYSPENFDGRFAGPLPAREALVRSRNVPALWVASKLTNPSFYDFLHTAGISRMKSEQHYGLALVLGGVEVTMEELAMLYAALANRGRLRPLRYRESEPEVAGVRVLSEEASFITVEMLRDNPRPDRPQSLPIFDEPAGGVGGAVDRRVAWKTGTSNGFRDAWTAGIFGPYVLVVWLGNFNGEGSPALVGVQAAAPLFFSITDALYGQHKGLLEPARPLPKNLSRVPVCAVSGQLPSRHCPHQRLTWFIPGRSPIEMCQIHRPVTIDDQTGKRVCGSRTVGTHTEVFEFWPSDLLRLFQQAGLPRRVPPSGADCDLTAQSTRGNPPRITSPLRGVTYSVRRSDGTSAGNDDPRDRLSLQATTDADVRELFWFEGGTLIGKSHPHGTLEWRPTPGRYLLRVVDDHGRADSREVAVEALH